MHDRVRKKIESGKRNDKEDRGKYEKHNTIRGRGSQIKGRDTAERHEKTKYRRHSK